MVIQPKFGFVVEYVPDIEAAKRFYVEVLGLVMERYWSPDQRYMR